MSSIDAWLRQYGIDSPVRQLEGSAWTVSEAAKALQCREGQIGKSIVFRGQASSGALLVVASGSNRISERRIGELSQEPVQKAGADFVRERTGYAIGGVPPFGHRETLKTYLDVDLLEFNQIYVAAGSPRSVLLLSREELCNLLSHATRTSIT